MNRVFFTAIICSSIWSSADVATDFRWERSETTLALVHNDTTLWQFNAGPEHAKPCFHPLNMIDGIMLTNLYPDDHPWHRGVWFCWKQLNGVDFWGENRKTHQSWAGKTDVTHLEFHPHDDFSADLILTLTYTPPRQQTLLLEQRTIHVSAPTVEGDYAITSEHVFIAAQDTVINKNYYGGFAFRLGPDLKRWAYLNANGEPYRNKSGGKGEELNSAPTPWMCALSQREPPFKGLALFDHPDNIRHPVQWCCISGFPYFNPVFCYPEDLTLKKDEHLRLRYQIQVFAHKNDLAYLRECYQRFANSQTPDKK